MLFFTCEVVFEEVQSPCDEVEIDFDSVWPLEYRLLDRTGVCSALRCRETVGVDRERQVELNMHE